MDSFEDIHHRVMGMPETDCRQELADTLRAMSQLESDFETLLKEVVRDTMQTQHSKLREIMERRGLK